MSKCDGIFNGTDSSIGGVSVISVLVVSIGEASIFDVKVHDYGEQMNYLVVYLEHSDRRSDCV